MLLYLIRHGDPDYPTNTLTLRGMFQAEAVGKRMADAGIDRIFSSPMGRARLTASPAARLTGLPIEIEEWTHEIGKEKNTTFPDGKRKSISLVPNIYLRENGAWDVPYDQTLTAPGFDTIAEKIRPTFDYIDQSGRDFLERLGYREENGVYRILRENNEKVALFCHAAFSRAWISVLLHIPVHIMWSSFDYCYTGVSVIEFKNNENGITAPTCLHYADISHLYAEGVDL
jgi:probable phosphoglycerate mutase